MRAIWTTRAAVPTSWSRARSSSGAAMFAPPPCACCASSVSSVSSSMPAAAAKALELARGSRRSGTTPTYSEWWFPPLAEVDDRMASTSATDLGEVSRSFMADDGSRMRFLRGRMESVEGSSWSWTCSAPLMVFL